MRDPSTGLELTGLGQVQAFANNSTKLEKRLKQIAPPMIFDCKKLLDTAIQRVNPAKSNKDWINFGKPAMNLFFSNSEGKVPELFRNILIQLRDLVDYVKEEDIKTASDIAKNLVDFAMPSSHDFVQAVPLNKDCPITIYLCGATLFDDDSNRFGRKFCAPAFQYWDVIPQIATAAPFGAFKAPNGNFDIVYDFNGVGAKDYVKTSFIYNPECKEAKYRSWGALLAHELVHIKYHPRIKEPKQIPTKIANYSADLYKLNSQQQTELEHLLASSSMADFEKRQVLAFFSPGVVEFFLDFLAQMKVP